MSKGVFISFLLALLLLVSLASAESTGITILYPENNEVLDPGEEMVMLVFQVPEAHKEEFFNYILTDTATNEVVEADEMDVDPEDMTGVIGFDMSTFEKGGSYRIRVTGKTPDAGDASILFSIGTESTKQEDSLSEAEPLASPSATPERTENDFILSLVSPADGNEIDPAETADVQFLWVLDEYPVSDVAYEWSVETDKGENILKGHGRMNSQQKQYGFATPADLFPRGEELTFRVTALEEDTTVSFSIAKAPDPTPTPAATPTPTPEPKATQEQLIASAAKKIGVPRSYISKVRVSGETVYPFAAVLESGTYSGDSVLRIVQPANGTVFSFHETMFFEVSLEVLSDLNERLTVSFQDPASGNTYYIMNYDKPAEAGKTVRLAVPCRYFTTNSLVSMRIDGPNGTNHGETLFSFRAFVPTPKPTQVPTPAPTEQPTAAPAAVEAPAAATAEPAETMAPAADETKPAQSEVEPGVGIQEFQGRVKVHRDASINIRELPDSKSRKLAIATPNSVFKCTGKTDNGWYRIILRDGRTGYISAKLSRLLRK